MFYAMRLALQEQRARDNAEYHQRGKLPNTVNAKVDQVLYMATLGGAKAIHREKDIGSLEPGKYADLILIRTDSPSMIASTDYGAAMVMHANPSDVEMVMINGEIVKQSGKLLKLDWDNFKVQLMKNREELEQRWQHVDWEQNKADLVDLWGVGETLE
jgi:cytosine/adenosine deaminase-related metal-dependent hydrolase